MEKMRPKTRVLSDAPKKKYEAGDMYGDLKIVRRDESAKKPSYICECTKCGWVGSVRTDRLQAGHTSKCNCSQSNVPAKPGDVYGDIIVLYADNDVNKNSHGGNYICKCMKCGWVGSLRMDNVKKYGRTSKCNCTIVKNTYHDETSLIGKIFGSLKVIGFGEYRKGKDSLWLCECLLCGKHIKVSKTNLTTGNSTKCRECSDRLAAGKRIINKVEVGDHFGKSPDPEKYVVIVSLDRYDTSQRLYYWNWKCNFCGTEGTSNSYYLSHLDVICSKCRNIPNIKNRRFNKLTVVKFSKIVDHSHAIWECRCDCGNTIGVLDSDLFNGKVLSCGCDHYKEGDLNYPREILNQLKHRYRGMYERCYNENNVSYRNYGAKGIKIDDRWLGPDGLSNFIKDMGPTFDPNLTIDRTDPKGNYSKENCTWADNKHQQNNRTDNVPVEYNGVTYKSIQLLVDDLIDKGYISRNDYRITHRTIYARLSDGWDLKSAINIPAPISDLRLWLKEHNLESVNQIPDYPIRKAIIVRGPQAFEGCLPEEIPYYSDEVEDPILFPDSISCDDTLKGTSSFIKKLN